MMWSNLHLFLTGLHFGCWYWWYRRITGLTITNATPFYRIFSVINFEYVHYSDHRTHFPAYHLNSQRHIEQTRIQNIYRIMKCFIWLWINGMSIAILALKYLSMWKSFNLNGYTIQVLDTKWMIAYKSNLYGISSIANIKRHAYLEMHSIRYVFLW